MRLNISNKVEYKLIFLLALNYATIIVFPAFGPILGLYSDLETGLLLSTLFLFVFSAGIFLLPKFKTELNGKLWKVICLASIFMVLFFPAFGIMLKGMTMILAGLFTARALLIWSAEYLSNQLDLSYGKFFTSILFLSYATLYFFNVLSPDLPGSIAIFFPVAGFSLLLVLHVPNPKATRENMLPDTKVPSKYLFPIFVIYISAGITYAGIYPSIARFELYDRFYNVLPFLASLPFAYWTHKKRGVKALLWSGISLLGLSFLFHIYELRVWNYLIIQTLLQSGWAFMNTFVWIFASDIARINRNPYYFSSTIATFLMGTSIGSAFYILLCKVFPYPHISFLGLLPILGVLVFTQMIPDNLKDDIAVLESSQLEVLTQREKEIFLMLLDNMKNKDIAKSLNISPNTLKKHCGSIYRKLYVENKTGLIKVYGNMKNA
ncbi:MAG TPA: helix-turn-helix transcriptional regulator [Clostridia bacterium]|nr:helix-turn-helix transcriptional regulator [Clostridia bacterium]